MTNEVTAPKTFQERMKERIKDSIGDLITDEELGQLVAKGINEAFFEPQRVVVNARFGGTEVQTKQALMPEIVKDLVADQVREAVQKYIAENQDKIAPIIEKVIREGAGKIFLEAITHQYQFALTNMGMQIHQMHQALMNNNIR
jgi:DNA gyrase/topoisomerase IV subunit B